MAKSMKCHVCGQKTLKLTAERYRSLADEMAVWECVNPECGHREGHATGNRAGFDVTTEFRHTRHSG